MSFHERLERIKRRKYSQRGGGQSVSEDHETIYRKAVDDRNVRLAAIKSEASRKFKPLLDKINNVFYQNKGEVRIWTESEDGDRFLNSPLTCRVELMPPEMYHPCLGITVWERALKEHPVQLISYNYGNPEAFLHYDLLKKGAFDSIEGAILKLIQDNPHF